MLTTCLAAWLAIDAACLQNEFMVVQLCFLVGGGDAHKNLEWTTKEEVREMGEDAECLFTRDMSCAKCTTIASESPPPPCHKFTQSICTEWCISHCCGAPLVEGSLELL